MAVDKIDAERYRALRRHRLEYFPYLKFWPNHESWKGKWAIKIPSTDLEADEAVDQMIEQFESYR